MREARREGEKSDILRKSKRKEENNERKMERKKGEGIKVVRK